MPYTSAIRVLVVDDSTLARRIISEILCADPQISIVGEARDGHEAVEQVATLHPDVIIMDVLMPLYDGLQATEAIMAYHPTPILVLTSALDNDEAGLGFQMLSAGALEVIEKPKNIIDPRSVVERQYLIDRVKILARVKVVTHLRGRRRARTAAPVAIVAPAPSTAPRFVVIGASTGGPRVMHTLVRALPASFPAGVLLVQHIASGFVANMVEWLNSASALPIQLAVDGATLQPGHILVAPETCHTRLDKHGRINLDVEPRHLPYPSIDVAFYSVAEQCPRRTIGVLLTGMGRDGAAGLLALRQAGGTTLAQDAATSTIWGMPRAALENGGAMQSVGADGLAARLIELVAARQVAL